ncbi:hypothetical protein EJ03DRAFT_18051 [Teratosphaeria nubilosa]|uniref:Uncharacterized protein n=1 Tax=Teratosphaeria nubilosa TaxID=161662 RepID=A0A6G1KXA3_9PEZI|nr:hypothetical protein EJ03DRAFT_18051 [Teratosphaeria nubilosa]
MSQWAFPAPCVVLLAFGLLDRWSIALQFRLPGPHVDQRPCSTSSCPCSGCVPPFNVKTSPYSDTRHLSPESQPSSSPLTVTADGSITVDLTITTTPFSAVTVDGDIILNLTLSFPSASPGLLTASSRLSLRARPKITVTPKVQARHPRNPRVKNR